MAQQSQTRNHFLDKKLLGTLFEEEEITKKDNFFNMEARDDKGHKRFHGAFEGGFEAGYKNTVGSKQGWAPQKFLSTRTNRAQYNNQTIKDFMDEDDIGRQKLGVNVTINPDYDTFGINEISYLQQQLGSGSGWLLESAPEELVYRDNKSIGYQAIMKLRKEMIRKRSTNIDQVKEDVQFHNLRNLNTSNQQFTGLGYNRQIDTYGTPSNPLEQAFWTFVKQNAVMIVDHDEGKRKKENRINMNGENPEDKEEYNQTLVEEDQFDNPRKQVKGAADIGLKFVKDLIPLRMEVEDHRINVPDNYDPYNKAKKLLAQGLDESFLFINKTNYKKSMNSSRREEIFREEETAASIKKDINSKKFVKATNQTMQVDQNHQQQREPQKQQEDKQDIVVLNLFPHQYEKQKRYAYYVKSKLNLPVEQPIELEEYEKVDFERLYQMFQIQSKNVVEQPKEDVKPVPQQEKISPFFSQRTHKRWIPEDMFCKRMGVPLPYTADERTMIEKINQREQKQRNIATNNRHFLIMDKKEFTSGGFIQSQEGSQSKAQFDPVALGLPLSFKSHSYDRNQPERLQQIENIERAQTQIPSKAERRNNKYMEDQEEQIPSRIQDQNIFELIFGDDDDEGQ